MSMAAPKLTAETPEVKPSKSESSGASITVVTPGNKNKTARENYAEPPIRIWKPAIILGDTLRIEWGEPMAPASDYHIFWDAGKGG